MFGAWNQADVKSEATVS